MSLRKLSARKCHLGMTPGSNNFDGDSNSDNGIGGGGGGKRTDAHIDDSDIITTHIVNNEEGHDDDSVQAAKRVPVNKKRKHGR